MWTFLYTWAFHLVDLFILNTTRHVVFTWLRMQPALPWVFSTRLKMGKFQLLSWLIRGSRPGMTGLSGADTDLSWQVIAKPGTTLTFCSSLRATHFLVIVKPIKTVYLWRWQEWVKNNVLCRTLPAAISHFRWLFASLSFVIVLCKVTAVTVVGLISAVIGAVVVWRSYNTLIWEGIKHNQKFVALNLGYHFSFNCLDEMFLGQYLDVVFCLFYCLILLHCLVGWWTACRS